MDVEVLGWEKIHCAKCKEIIGYKVDGKLRLKWNRTWFTMYSGVAEIPCEAKHLTTIRLTPLNDAQLTV